MKKLSFSLFIAILASVSGYAQVTNPGSLSSVDTVKCINVNSGTILLSGQNGNVIRWEYSYSNSDPWTPIVTNSATYNFSNLAQTTHFRAIVQHPSSVPLPTASIKIRIDQLSQSGSISGSNTVCNTDLNLFQLNGAVGSVIGWQESTTAGATWSLVANSNDSLSILRSIPSNRLYQVRVENGSCPPVFSPNFSITVFEAPLAGNVSGTNTVCSGTNTINISTAGSSASSLDWQTAINSNGPWSNFGGSGTTTAYSDITAATFFRVIGSNPACASDTSNVHQVSVVNSPVGGNVVGSSIVCSGEGTTLNLVNYQGTSIQWEKTTDGGATWLPVATGVTEINTGALTIATIFRASITNTGCSIAYSSLKTVNVSAAPISDFTVTNACEGIATTMVNQSSGATTYQWDNGDGTSSTSVNSTQTYIQAGNYTVKLIATNSDGCIDSSSQVVSIFAGPQADFSFPDTICLNENIQFVNSSQSSSGTISNTTWTFNSGAQSSATNPMYSTFPAGNNLVNLHITSSNGCVDSMLKTVVVRDNPVIQFNAGAACFGTATSFVNTSYSGSGGVSYAWDFGDGSNSTATSPSHNYGTSGSFNVQLVAVNDYLCTDSDIQPILVNSSPTVNFSYSNVCLYDSMQFTSAVTPSMGTTLNWSFGDGTNSSDMNPTHLFGNYGTYQVQLTATTTNGCTANSSQTAEVYAVPNASFLIGNTCELDSIQINNLTSISSGTASSAWNFGNGLTSLQEAPKVAYSGPGNYTIVLVSTSNNACTDTSTSTVQVYDKPIASFTATEICYGNPTVFTNTSAVTSGSITQTMWDFGDNSNSTLMNPSKEYLNSGQYNVQLIVASSNGCADTNSQTITVHDAPIANFEVLSNCLGDETTFNNLTTISLGVFSSVWDFGDADSSSAFAPTHTYTTSGFFTAKVVITSDFGCKDSISKMLAIYGLPNIDAGSDTTIEKGFGILLQATGGLTYTWQPSQGLNNPQIAQPFASPDSTTNYIVTSSDIHGCFGSDSVLVTVEETFRVVPFNIVTPDNNKQNDTWIIKNIESYPNNEIAIFNELGHEVYTANQYNNEWDGRNKTGEILPDGTYYYILTFDGADKVYKGDILLIRNKN